MISNKTFKHINGFVVLVGVYGALAYVLGDMGIAQSAVIGIAASGTVSLFEYVTS